MEQKNIIIDSKNNISSKNFTKTKPIIHKTIQMNNISINAYNRSIVLFSKNTVVLSKIAKATRTNTFAQF